MKYSLANPLHREQLKARLQYLLHKETGIVELREVRPQRTVQQNRYLWLAISYFALQTGYTKEEAEAIYKKVCRDVYVTTFTATNGEVTHRLRHTHELSTEEMSHSIDRFLAFAAAEAGIYIPTPDDLRAVAEMEMEVERSGKYL